MTRHAIKRRTAYFQDERVHLRSDGSVDVVEVLGNFQELTDHSPTYRCSCGEAFAKSAERAREHLQDVANRATAEAFDD